MKSSTRKLAEHKDFLPTFANSLNSSEEPMRTSIDLQFVSVSANVGMQSFDASATFGSDDAFFQGFLKFC